MSNDNELNKQPPSAAHASSGDQPAGHQPPPPATHPAAGIEARPAARLLEFLVCPSTKGPLELSADRTELNDLADKYPKRVAEMTAAYAQWRQGDGGRALRQAIARGEQHFDCLAQQALGCHARGGEAATAAVERLLTADAAVCAG